MVLSKLRNSYLIDTEADKIHSTGDQGSFHTEAGTYGLLLTGQYEVNKDGSLMNGQILGNFLSGPYPVPSSTIASEDATDAGVVPTTVSSGATTAPNPTSLLTTVDSLVATSTTPGAAAATTTKPSAADKIGGQLLTCAVAAGAVIGYLFL